MLPLPRRVVLTMQYCLCAWYGQRSTACARGTDTPPPPLQTLLALAEFMEHDEKPLPIDIRKLGAVAEKCQVPNRQFFSSFFFFALILRGVFVCFVVRLVRCYEGWY